MQHFLMSYHFFFFTKVCHAILIRLRNVRVSRNACENALAKAQQLLSAHSLNNYHPVNSISLEKANAEE